VEAQEILSELLKQAGFWSISFQFPLKWSEDIPDDLGAPIGGVFIVDIFKNDLTCDITPESNFPRLRMALILGEETT
jgi:hypothetical protein